MTNTYETPDMFTVPADWLPSGQFEVQFKEPFASDYLKARKKYPEPRYQGDPDGNQPYSLDELLLAYLLDTINGRQLSAQPKDMAERLNPFFIRDRQALMQVLFEAYYLTNELAEEARDFAEAARKTFAKTYSIGTDRMPSGLSSVTFYTPNTQVQHECQRLYRNTQLMGATGEEALMAYCLHSIQFEGFEWTRQSNNSLQECIDAAGKLKLIDYQYANAFFMTAFSLTIEQADSLRAKVRARKESLKKSTTEPAKKSTTKTKAGASASQETITNA